MGEHLSGGVGTHGGDFPELFVMGRREVRAARREKTVKRERGR